MRIVLLSCAYSQNLSLKFNDKSNNILAMKWFVRFSNNTWKRYQLTLYTPSNKKKYGTISKGLSSKSKKENPETTYIQINNLEAVEELQKRAEAIKISIKVRETKETDLPDPTRIDTEDHFIDPKAFVDTKKLLFIYPDRIKKTKLYSPNYYEIKEYLRNRIEREIELSHEEPHFRKHIEKQIEASPKEPPKKKKSEKEEEDKENISPSSDLAKAPTALKSNNRIKSISSCCNLKIIATIILALSISLFGSFYKN